MLLTKQQKYLLAVLEKLGCAEQRQLAALLQKTFAFSSIDDAVRVTNACVRQMQMGGLLQISDNIVSHCGERAVSQQIMLNEQRHHHNDRSCIAFTKRMHLPYTRKQPCKSMHKFFSGELLPLFL